MAQQYVTYGSYDMEEKSEYLFPNERMYIHSSVFLPSSDIDPRTGLLRPDQPRRGRTQAMRAEYDHLDKEYQKLDESLRKRMEKAGPQISLRSAVLLVITVFFFMGITLLTQQGTLVQREKTLRHMNKAIVECERVNDDLATQIMDASDATKICYAAARDLNMIPAEAAEAIHLVAMDTRPTEPMDRYTAKAEDVGMPTGEAVQEIRVEPTEQPSTIASAKLGE